MSNLYRRLPPLNLLIGFEAAARLESFSLAAEELNITQSAISHQIRTLEDFLGQPLFHRAHRRITLTDAGIDLMQTAEAALETVRQGVRRLEAYSKPGSVILHMPSEVGALWFLPRLAAFRTLHPAVDPWLFTTFSNFDLTESEIDISVTRAPVLSKETILVPFLSDSRIPLACPDLANRGGDPFQESTLLHDESTDDWQKWFGAAGLDRRDLASGPNFTDAALMLEAAARGLGICLGGRALAAPMIDDGRLVALSDIAIDEEQPYYMVTLQRNLQRAGVRALWDWLCAETGGAGKAEASVE